MSYSKELKYAKKAAWRAISELELYKRKRTATNTKSDHPLDTVTEFDIKAENIIVDYLSEEFDYGFLTEEDDYDGETDIYWCIDPIDGTTNFSRGFSPWGVSIALVKGETPLVGVVAQLPESRMFSAVRGEGSYVEDNLDYTNTENMPNYSKSALKGRELSVNDTEYIEKSMIKTANNDKSKTYSSTVEFIKYLEERSASIRNNGCCTADICAIAEGVIDGRANSNLERWDVDAARLILEEAGGDYRMRRSKSGKIEFIATNGEIQKELEDIWDKKTTSKRE